MMASLAWAQGASEDGGSAGVLVSLVPFFLILVIFYFLLIQPQRKRQKQLKVMQEELKKGDKIVTSSGIWGTVTNLGKETVTLQVSDNTKVKIQRDHVSRMRSSEDE